MTSSSQDTDRMNETNPSRPILNIKYKNNFF